MFFGYIIRKEAADNVVACDEISGETEKGRTTEMRLEGLRQWHRRPTAVASPITKIDPEHHGR